MAVNGVGDYNYRNWSDYNTSTKYNAEKTAADEEAVQATGETAESKESSVTAAPKQSETYKPDMDKINAMKADLKNNMTAFKQMVFSQVRNQGTMSNTANGGFNMAELLKNISPEEAQANISEDGYWGVNATANRILDFAKALSGGDPSKIAELRDAVEKGFGAAEKVWGGKLPGISYDTKAKIMEGFDAWEKEANGTTEVTEE